MCTGLYTFLPLTHIHTYFLPPSVPRPRCPLFYSLYPLPFSISPLPPLSLFSCLIPCCFSLRPALLNTLATIDIYDKLPQETNQTRRTQSGDKDIMLGNDGKKKRGLRIYQHTYIMRIKCLFVFVKLRCTQ